MAETLLSIPVSALVKAKRNGFDDLYTQSTKLPYYERTHKLLL